MSALSFENVSIIFGKDNPTEALRLMDEGQSREHVREATDQTFGVHDASLAVEEGEICVLMGLSGSGKSTLMRASNGLAPVRRGRVTVKTADGPVDVTNASERTLRDLRRGRVAMVFQQFALLPWRTVHENVAFGLELAGIPASKRRQQVDRQLELVGLSGVAEDRISALSGGMQQRVGLARAFATDAPILLMDEPFSALDPLIRTRLQDELIALQKDLKRTILFVSHDLDEAFRIGDRIAVMEGGRIVQAGTPQQIATAPATQYVADFVAHMNPVNVLRAEDVMVPCPADYSTTDGTERRNADCTLGELIALVNAGHGTVEIVSDAGTVGLVDAAAVMQSLERGTP